jgi:hypothetical protein
VKVAEGKDRGISEGICSSNGKPHSSEKQKHYYKITAEEFNLK